MIVAFDFLIGVSISVMIDICTGMRTRMTAIYARAVLIAVRLLDSRILLIAAEEDPAICTEHVDLLLSACTVNAVVALNLAEF